MIPEHTNRALLWVAGGHVVLALACLLLLWTEAPSLMGVHPALKPLKFGISIAVFLGTMAFLVPSLSIGPVARGVLVWVLSLTMVAEMAAIVVQALRGTTSHFNVQGSFNQTVWSAMMGAIVIATLAMVVVAVVATVRPLRDVAGAPMPPLLSTAWRAGLWLFLLAGVSGFAMGGRAAHAIGGVDGGPGLPLVNWSTTAGDLRVSHFFSMHALQVFPILAWIVGWIPLVDGARWVTIVVAMGAYVLVAVGTLFQALAGRPFG